MSVRGQFTYRQPTKVIYQAPRALVIDLGQRQNEVFEFVANVNEDMPLTAEAIITPDLTASVCLSGNVLILCGTDRCSG